MKRMSDTMKAFVISAVGTAIIVALVFAFSNGQTTENNTMTINTATTAVSTMTTIHNMR